MKQFPDILQLELSGNEISDISVLGQMRYLTHIELSQNNIGDNLKIEPVPYNLQYIDISHNTITKISDLSIHRFLNALNLNCFILMI